MFRLSGKVVLTCLTLTAPAIAQGVSEKPLFLGQWTLAGRDVTCGSWPRNLVVSAADSKRIVADGKEYSVTGLAGHPPRDRENIVITRDFDFQIFGDAQKDMVVNFKTNDRVTGECHYVRITPIRGN